MRQKSTPPAAEVTVVPERARIADQQPAGPIEPQLSPQAQGAESVDTFRPTALCMPCWLA
jgi:hypothetical protein